MQKLKLPEYDCQVRGEHIFCLIRKKWIFLTPEEWVRQHFIHLLVSHLGYPKGLISLEHSFHYFKHQKRSDIVVFDREGQVFLLVECKSADVNLGKKTITQLSNYNKVLDARYVAITNGLQHFVWKRTGEEFLQTREFPSFNG